MNSAIATLERALRALRTELIEDEIEGQVPWSVHVLKRQIREHEDAIVFIKDRLL